MSPAALCAAHRCVWGCHPRQVPTAPETATSVGGKYGKRRSPAPRAGVGAFKDVTSRARWRGGAWTRARVAHTVAPGGGTVAPGAAERGLARSPAKISTAKKKNPGENIGGAAHSAADTTVRTAERGPRDARPRAGLPAPRGRLLTRSLSLPC